jgi:hypothetical protein
MNSEKKRRSAQVPAQFLGYSLQTTRATMRLLQANPGTSVTVEVLDDVAVLSPSGSATVEQTKSATSTNPIADRSPELWKTLANWVRAAESKQVDPAATTFEIFVSKKRSGSIAHSFSAASDLQSALQALATAKTALWGTAPKFPKRAKVAATLAPHVECVLSAQNGLASKIVQRLNIVFGSGSSKADLLNALSAKIISSDMLDTVANQMLGWVKATLDGCVEKSKPAVISTDAFNAELTAFVRKYDRFAILNSFAPAPARPMLDLEVQSRTYVRQLDIIGADYDAKLKAANDFLRASIDRSVWATKGLVHRSSFDEFEDLLTRTWTAKREIVAIQSKGQPSDACGRLLYSECSLVQCPLEGRSVPPHFTPGCYHALAESQSLGWHPKFKDILAAASSKKDSTT